MNAHRFMLLALLVLSIYQHQSPTLAAQNTPALPPGDDAKVTRIVNGDTIEVVIQGIGFTIGYLGIDAPDPATAKTKAQCYSWIASAYNAGLVRGQTVRVERDVSDFEPTGRLLRYVYLQDGRMVNEELLKGGYARVSNTAPDRRYEDRFIAAQQAAQSQRRGLWGVCSLTPSPTPTALSRACVTISMEELDKRGPRPDVLNNVQDGGCVLVEITSILIRFIWHPVGTRLRLERSMYIRWKDAFVTIRRTREGKLTTRVHSFSIGTKNGYPAFYQHVDDKELERGGERGQILMLPSSGTFIFEDVGNDEYVALVDVLQLDYKSQSNWPAWFRDSMTGMP